MRMTGEGSGRPDLLLFTGLFPYGSGEAFLEAEIGYLAAAFDTILLVPRQISGPLRELPANVRVEDSLATRHRMRWPGGSLARALLDRRFYDELAHRSRTFVQPRAARRLVGYTAAAARVSEWLAELVRIRRVRLDRTLCYTYWLWSETTGLASLRLRHPEMRIVSRAHGFDLYSERHDNAYIPLRPFTLAATEKVFAVSQHGCEYLQAHYPTAAARISVARLGVQDPGQVSPRSSDGALRIVTCSRIESVKRLELAIHAIAELARIRRRLRVEWVHFGEGELRPVIQRIAERELPGSVGWSLRGEVPNAAVREHFRHRPVDVLLNVSWSEGVPVTMMEAQSFGVPVVATAVGGVPEIVGSQTGVLLSPDPSPAEIADALGRIADGTLRVSDRHQVRARWQARYDAAENYQEFAAMIRSIG